MQMYQVNHNATPQGYPAPQGYPGTQPGTMMQPGMMMQTGMQPGMMMPGMMMRPDGGNIIMYQAKWGWEKLNERDGIFVKQKFDLLETITGCERGNKYDVFPIDKNGDKKGKSIFKALEKSSWCARNCLKADCQPFRMQIKNTDQVSEEIDDTDFLSLQRDCAWTCLCLNRPVMTVSNVEKGANEYLGKIRQPWMCCDLGVDIYNAQDEKNFEIRGGCCQLGLCCSGCPCDSCQLVEFDLKNTTGEVVGSLQKRSPGCAKELIGSDADNFSMVFPPTATKEDKALLLSSILLMDFTYFESNGKKNNNLN